MNSNLCRWGFLGAAAIARKNWKAIRRSGNGVVAAVASRDRRRAQAFIDECAAECPQVANDKVVAADAVEGYESLLNRDDIDAVYIPLPTGVRKSWVIRAAQAGKHVLCEKPVAINADEAKAMIDACRSAGVQFMDGVMFDHSARLDGVRSSLRDTETFGSLQRINTHFSFCGDESFEDSNIRAQADLEPHGCLGDLGWYCIRFTLFVTGGRMPNTVTARSLKSLGQEKQADGTLSAGVPGTFSAEMTFDDGVSAAFYCSFLSANQQTALISGDRGYLTLDDFVLPLYGARSEWELHRHDLQIDNCQWNFARKTTGMAVDEYASGQPDSQEVNMVRRLAEIALSGRLSEHYAELSLKTQLVLDACRRSDAHGGKSVQPAPFTKAA